MEERSKNVEEEHTGAAGEVFARVLKAVAGVKLTRQGTFVSPAGGSAIRVSHKADVGFVFTRERILLLAKTTDFGSIRGRFRVRI